MSPPPPPSKVISLFAFQPPTGGDIVLKSREGTIFNVHSALLGLASTVFAGMFNGALTADPVELAEDAESISLMLAFIYPVTSPPITTIEQLEKVMIFSQKYDIAKTIDYVENIRPESELINSDPIRLFRASKQYNFPTIKTLSARALRPKHCDISTTLGFVELARQLPEASPVIGLIGAQILRRHMLPGVVLRVTAPRCAQSRAPGIDDHIPYMTCRSCWDKSHVTRTMSAHYNPGWLWNWRNMVQSQLLNEPMHGCEDIFRIVCFTDTSKWPFGKLGCEECVARTLTKRSMFEGWARGVKKHIEKELKALDLLYTL